MNQATPRCLHQLSFYSLVAFAALALGCQPAATRQGVAPDLGPALQALVDGAVEDNEAVHGAALHVDTPALDLVWEGAADVLRLGFRSIDRHATARDSAPSKKSS